MDKLTYLEWIEEQKHEEQKKEEDVQKKDLALHSNPSRNLNADLLA